MQDAALDTKVTQENFSMKDERGKFSNVRTLGKIHSTADFGLIAGAIACGLYCMTCWKSVNVRMPSMGCKSYLFPHHPHPL